MKIQFPIFTFVMAASCSAAVSVSGVTTSATQALIHYKAPDLSACTVEVSESPTYTPLVHDVDATLFAGANLDSRAGGVARGTDRWFVAGARIAQVATDTLRYSRALQTATTHYYRITCNGAQASGTFATTTIPFGNTYAEPEAADPLSPGDYAYPTLSTSDRTQVTIDPQTGVLLRRLTMPGDFIFGNTTSGFQIGRGGAWSGISGLIAGTGAATISGNAQKLFLGMDQTPSQLQYLTSYGTGYGSGAPLAFRYYQVSLKTAINAGGTAPGNPADAAYSICMTIDGVNCYKGSSVFQGSPGVAYATQTFGTQNTIDLWQSTPGTRVPDYRDQAPHDNTSSCNGGAVVTQTGGEPYSIHWGPGSNLRIGGVDYTIAQVNHTAQITLTSNCPAASGLATAGWNFGILVWKNTASADTLSIQSATVNYGLSGYFIGTVGGGVELASPGTVNGPNGDPGYNFQAPTGPGKYWIDDLTGEAHLTGVSATSPGVGCDAMSGKFDPSDPDTMVCYSSGVLSRVKFYTSHADLGSVGFFSGTPACTTAGNMPPYTSQQPCYVAQSLTPGTDIPTLTVAFTSQAQYAPQFDPALFNNLRFSTVDTLGNIQIAAQRSGYESTGWIILFNAAAVSNVEGGSSTGAPGNHGCVGGGTPGCVIAAIPGWARPGCRWCTLKGTDFAVPGWPETSVGGWNNTSAGTGPYTIPVADGSANGTINYFDNSTSLQACPINTYGAAGNNCTTVTIGAEPSSPNHGAGETGLPGELGPMMPGDEVTVSPESNNTEIMMLIRKVAGAGGTWVETFWRNYNRFGLHANTGANPVLQTNCNSNQTPWVVESGGTWFWNALADPHGMNANGASIPPDLSSQGAHYFWSNGVWGASTTPSTEARCSSGIFNCYATRLPSEFNSFIQELAGAPTAVIVTTPSFAGGKIDQSAIQSHPTPGGIFAMKDRANYMFDGRPYYGGVNSGEAAGGGLNPATLVTGQLWKFSAAQVQNLDLPYRKLTPTAAFTGQLPLIDISSPAQGNTIATDATKSYTYCVAAVAGECRVGSAAGDVYVNAPYVRYPYCFQAAQDGNLSDDYDLCVSGSPSIRDAITQIAMDKVDNSGARTRVLSKFVRARVLSPFWTPYVLPDGKWMTFESHLGGDGSANKAYFVGKIPPPGPVDSNARNTFQSISFKLPGYRDFNSAYVEFGYAENGNAPNLFCTSRAETCVATAAAVNAATPFYFLQTESWSPVACASGCSIAIPAIPQRALYYRYVYAGASGAKYMSPMSVVLVP